MRGKNLNSEKQMLNMYLLSHQIFNTNQSKKKKKLKKYTVFFFLELKWIISCQHSVWLNFNEDEGLSF